MKKDIQIPEVKGVHLAAVYVLNEEFNQKEWNVYLINETGKDLEMVLIVSSGKDKKRKTSTLRHKLEKLPASGFAKIEFLSEDVLQLENEFRVSYFLDDQLHDKLFKFPKHSIKESALKEIPIIPEKGILAK